MKLNLLRILRAVCDVHPNRAMLVERYSIYELVVRLRREDGAVLVRELAREIEPALRPALSRSSTPKTFETPKSSLAPKRRTRRTASDTTSFTSGVSSSPGHASSRESRRLQLPQRTRLGDVPWQASEAR